MEARLHQFLSDSFVMFAALGTEAIRTLHKLTLSAAMHGRPIRHGENAWLVPFDTHLAVAGDAASHEPAAEGLPSLAPLFIEAQLADRESRERMRQDGELWFLTRHQCEHPGTREDGLGTGNCPAWGRADFRMNEQEFGKSVTEGFHAYMSAPRKVRAAAEQGQASAEESLPCVVIFPTVGGQGSGAFPDASRKIRLLAKEQGVPVKIIECPIDADTQWPANKAVAVRNRELAINTLRAELTGQYWDPEGIRAQLDGPFADMVLISSNASKHSEVPTLEAQEALLTSELHYLFYTTLGQRMREDIVDLEAHRGLDASGAPCAGSALGMSVINLDRGRVAEFASHTLGAEFTDAVLTASPGEAEELGRRAAGELSLVEGEAENQTTRYLSAPSDSGPDAFAEAQGSFRGRLAGLRGWKRGRMIHEAAQSITAELLGNVLEPRMKERADQLKRQTHDRWVKELAPLGKQLDGLARAKAFLNGLLSQLRGSIRENSEKQEAISQAAQGVAVEAEECRRAIEALGQRSWVGRLLRFFTVRDTVRRLEDISGQAIRLAVSLAACRIAHEDVYLPLQDDLLSELSRLQRLEAALQRVGQECRDRAKALLSAPPSLLRVPTGIELADAEFLRGFWEGHAAKGERLDRIEGQLLDGILDREGSLFHFLEGRVDELSEQLAGYARRPFEASIQALGVVDQLRQRFGGQRLAPLLARLIKESLPRIRTAGEAGREIPLIKLIGVPQGADVGWLRDAAAQLDRSGGQREFVELPLPCEAIVLVSYRSSVSLTTLIEQHAIPEDGRPVREQIEGAPDPNIALLPPGTLTDRGARVLAAHAVATGTLWHDDKTGYHLAQRDGRENALGASAAEVLSFLRRSFGDVAHIRSRLSEKLCDSGQEVLGNLHRMRSGLEGTKPEADGALYDSAALGRAIEEAQELSLRLETLQRK